jgi:hypothetical protein
MRKSNTKIKLKNSEQGSLQSCDPWNSSPSSFHQRSCHQSRGGDMQGLQWVPFLSDNSVADLPDPPRVLTSRAKRQGDQGGDTTRRDAARCSYSVPRTRPTFLRLEIITHWATSCEAKRFIPVVRFPLPATLTDTFRVSYLSDEIRTLFSESFTSHHL